MSKDSFSRRVLARARAKNPPAKTESPPIDPDTERQIKELCQTLIRMHEALAKICEASPAYRQERHRAVLASMAKGLAHDPEFREDIEAFRERWRLPDPGNLPEGLPCVPVPPPGVVPQGWRDYVAGGQYLTLRLDLQAPTKDLVALVEGWIQLIREAAQIKTATAKLSPLEVWARRMFIWHLKQAGFTVPEMLRLLYRATPDTCTPEEWETLLRQTRRDLAAIRALLPAT